MIDGIKINCQILDFPAWKNSVSIKLFAPTNLFDGEQEVKEYVNIQKGTEQRTITHTGSFESYKITIKEVHKIFKDGKKTVTYYLILDGSLHKNFFQGGNHLPFTWKNLQDEIKHIETCLQLFGDFVSLKNLEFGVNIPLPFLVFSFLQSNLLSYKGRLFNAYDRGRNGVCLGFECQLSHYSVKAYDKGLQFNLPENLMRFELRFLKMQQLQKLGFNTLSDLKNAEKVNGLLCLLLDAWDNVFLFDSSIKLNNPELKPQDRELLRNGSNPRFWMQLKTKDIRNFNFQRAKMKELITTYGQGWHKFIYDLVKSKWESLFENSQTLANQD